MPKVKHLEEIGNQLKLYYDDNTTAVAFPTMGSIWRVGGAGGGGGPVDPPDPGTSVIAWPYAPSSISDHFGLRSDVNRWHEGTDFSGGPAYNGAPVPALGAGVVDTINAFGDAFGNHVTVRYGAFVDGMWAGKQLTILCAHFINYPSVSVGDTVARGTTLGLLGNTGGSFGAHLHQEAHITDPGGALNFDYLNPVPAPPSNRTSVDFEIVMANYNAGGDVIYT